MVFSMSRILLTNSRKQINIFIHFFVSRHVYYNLYNNDTFQQYRPTISSYNYSICFIFLINTQSTTTYSKKAFRDLHLKILFRVLVLSNTEKKKQPNHILWFGLIYPQQSTYYASIFKFLAVWDILHESRSRSSILLLLNSSSFEVLSDVHFQIYTYPELPLYKGFEEAKFL